MSQSHRRPILPLLVLALSLMLALGTLLPAFAADHTTQPAFQVIATATPVGFQQDPYMVLSEDADQLRVRTGPYLGASLAEVVPADLATAEDNSIQVTQYPVLAKNRDENRDVYWYLTTVNGTTGWVSGKSVNVDLTGNGTFDITPDTPGLTLTAIINGTAGPTAATETTETEQTESITSEALQIWTTIPFAGSIFDEIGGAPDVGVTGLVLRTRNLHRRPSRRAEIIGELPVNTAFSVIGRTREITYDDWYQVRVGSVEGWVESRVHTAFPAVSVNPNLVLERVPIR